MTGIIQTMRDEVKRLSERVEELELLRESDRAHIDYLEVMLRKAGIPVPSPRTTGQIRSAQS